MSDCGDSAVVDTSVYRAEFIRNSSFKKISLMMSRFHTMLTNYKALTPLEATRCNAMLVQFLVRTSYTFEPNLFIFRALLTSILQGCLQTLT